MDRRWKYISTKALTTFLLIFNLLVIENIQKASRLTKYLHKFYFTVETICQKASLTLTRNKQTELHKVNMKVKQGRGLQSVEWAEEPHVDLSSESDLVGPVWVKFTH